ncbi:type 1 glutamine amidotransferase [Microbacterium sp. NPDC055357]
MTTLTIVQLYPDLLGVTGDRGNVDVLATRARFAGLTPEATRVGIGDPAPEHADAIVIGNGPLSAMRTVHADLLARREWITAQHSDGTAILCVGGGAELLSDGIDLLDDSRLEGLGLIPARVARTRTRRVGYIVADTPDGRLVGFEDHASEWTLLPAAPADARYGTVVSGRGGVAGGGETLRVEGLYATNVQGPVLPLNPQLADALLRRAAARAGAEYVVAAEHATLDRHADLARAAIERHARNAQFTAIQL